MGLSIWQLNQSSYCEHRRRVFFLLRASLRINLPFSSFSQRTRQALRWILEREEGSTNQAANSCQASRNGRFPCAKRLFVVCNVGHQIIRFGQFETFRFKREQNGWSQRGSWSGGAREGSVIEGSANSKRTVLSGKRTCWAHRGMLEDGGSC